ncbi:MAG: hypothetical protein CVU44_16745 [Chloroflexi bacterium HGW-Chloroflexi-6]|nr:MAG: hypothetical protein CVU44_16745 [Chloroflexi bacterium HGW-Chloroflexi-6]
MKATKTLPENYALAWEMDVEKDKRQMWLLQVLGLPWALLVLFFLGWFTLRVRPEVIGADPGEVSMGIVLALLPVMGISIMLHELVHGVFFWVFTREQPRFGFKLLYAYATAPGWHFSTSYYWLIGLAPLILLTAIGLAMVPLVPQILVYLLLFAIFTNASGAIGDLYIVILLALEPAGTLVEDQGTGFRVFRRLN